MKYSTSLILLLLSLVVNTISAQKPTMSTVGGTYTLVTSLDEIDDDGIYLIGVETGKTGDPMTLSLMSSSYPTSSTYYGSGFAYFIHSTDHTVVPTSIQVETVNNGMIDEKEGYPYEYRITRNPNGSFLIQDKDNKYVTNNKTTDKDLKLSDNKTNSEWLMEMHDAMPELARIKIYYTYNKTNYFIAMPNAGSGQTNNRYACVQASSVKAYANIYKKASSTLPLTIGATGYATLYYGKYDVLLPEGLMAYTYGATENNEGKVSLVKSNIFNGGDRIPAGTAVILRGKENTNYSLSLLTPDESLEKVTGNLLHGTDVATTTVAPDSRDYLFYKLSKSSSTADVSTLGFYWGAIDGGAFSIGAHKAYLALPTSQAAKLHSAVIYGNYEDELVAGIKHISHTEKTNNIITDLSGRRLTNKPSKGLYIQNGKKYIVK